MTRVLYGQKIRYSYLPTETQRPWIERRIRWWRMKSSSGFQLMLLEKLELMKKVRNLFFFLSERGQWRTAGIVTRENFTAVLQCFLQESKFLLQRQTSKTFWKLLKFIEYFKRGEGGGQNSTWASWKNIFKRQCNLVCGHIPCINYMRKIYCKINKCTLVLLT